MDNIKQYTPAAQKRNNRYPKEKWDQHRDTILSYHIKHGSRPKTAAYMRKTLNMNPSLAKLDAVLNSWGARIYLDKKLMIYIVQIKRRRLATGRKSSFAIETDGGLLKIAAKRILNFERRHAQECVADIRAPPYKIVCETPRSSTPLPAGVEESTLPLAVSDGESSSILISPVTLFIPILGATDIPDVSKEPDETVIKELLKQSTLTPLEDLAGPAEHVNRLVNQSQEDWTPDIAFQDAIDGIEAVREVAQSSEDDIKCFQTTIDEILLGEAVFEDILDDMTSRSRELDVTIEDIGNRVRRHIRQSADAIQGFSTPEDMSFDQIAESAALRRAHWSSEVLVGLQPFQPTMYQQSIQTEPSNLWTLDMPEPLHEVWSEHDPFVWLEIPSFSLDDDEEWREVLLFMAQRGE